LIGQTLSHFKITAKLGEGGMGEVYRAEDTKLGRDVAIKVLPEAFVEDKERLARFEREAKVLASLNHANIAGIHEVGEADVAGESLRFLVMELAPGEDLSDRLSRGAIPQDEALRLGIQIAEALEAAHENGIVHRDLKPANVKITPEGQIKVLDFGLAKAWAGPGGNEDMSHSPTLTAQMTQAGTLLGTAAYMSPEQARGEEADRRADVWAFGLILSEMLTGRKTFNEPTVSDTLAAVLKSDPDLSGLPTEAPPSLHRLIERCLRKDARERLRDMGDVGLELREIAAGPQEAVPSSISESLNVVEASSSRSWGKVIVAGALIGLAVAMAAWWLLPSTAPAGWQAETMVQFQQFAPEKTSYVRGLAVSPDGSTVAMTLLEQMTGQSAIWVREVASTEMRRVKGTEGARYPFWSPDSRKIGFFGAGELRVVDLHGTPPVTLAATAVPVDARGATWAGDTILYAPSFSGGLMQVSATGGKPEPVTVIDPEGKIGTHRFPWFLPDGEHFLVYAASGTGMEPAEVHIGSLGSSSTRRLVDSHSVAVFAQPGHLIYVKGDVLVAHAFDLERLEMVGDPMPLGPSLPGGLAVSGSRSLSASGSGTLVYRVEDFSNTRLTLVSDEGVELSRLGTEDTWHYSATFSPDGRSVLVSRYAPDTEGGDLWLYNVERGLGRPLAAGPGDQDTPVWSVDGQSVAFLEAGVVTRIFRVDVDGDGQQRTIYEKDTVAWPVQWLPDGAGVLLVRDTPVGDLGEMNSDLVVVASDGSGDIEEVLASRYSEKDGQVSPNGKWLAYTSDAGGRDEVYVVPFRGEGNAWQVSTDGGFRCRWSRDGTMLYFIGSDGWLHQTDVKVGDTLTTSEPRRLFYANTDRDQSDAGYDVGPDGTFLVNQRVDDAGEPVTVVIGWEQLLGSRSRP
jgi:Tol biopolymer transport system component